MKIGTFETHPAADVLPLLEGEEFRKLVEDVKKRGQRLPCVYVQVGKKQLLLDGRNRLRALIKLGIKPQFTAYTGDDPIGFVESMENRRHLTPSQRALIAAKFAKLRSGTKQTGKFAEVATQQQAASRHKVSERSVRTARVVLDKATPAVRKAVERGQMAIDAAAQLAEFPAARQRAIVKSLGKDKQVKSGHVRAIMRQEKKREVAARIDAERTPLPVGPFRVIVADCPWRYDNSDGHVGSRGHTDYPTMSVDELCALGPQVQALAHPEGSILWFWATNAHLVDGSAARVIHAWGWRPITPWTWKKNRVGLGAWLRNRTEHVILCVRGAPTMVNTTQTTLTEQTVYEGGEFERRVGRVVDEAFAARRELEKFARHMLERATDGIPASKLREDIDKVLALANLAGVREAAEALLEEREGDDLILGDVREHSRKPEAFFELVERMCPGEKIEMFAREARAGYARWGAESERFAAAS